MNKKTLFSIAGVVILVIVGIWLLSGKSSAPIQEQQENNQQKALDQSNQNTQNTQIAKPVIQIARFPIQPTKLSFSDASLVYANKRIQFNEDCVATPYQVTFNKGTVIMIHNGSSKAKYFYFDGVSHYVKAYDFILVALETSAKLPHKVQIDCGTGKNNATINLQ